jgi:hypothetical protein
MARHNQQFCRLFRVVQIDISVAPRVSEKSDRKRRLAEAAMSKTRTSAGKPADKFANNLKKAVTTNGPV